MDNLKRPRRTRVMLPGLGSTFALIALAGCQSYERVPLELADHRAALDARLAATEPISDFVERLSGAARSASWPLSERSPSGSPDLNRIDRPLG